MLYIVNDSRDGLWLAFDESGSSNWCSIEDLKLDRNMQYSKEGTARLLEVCNSNGHTTVYETDSLDTFKTDYPELFI